MPRRFRFCGCPSKESPRSPCPIHSFYLTFLDSRTEGEFLREVAEDIAAWLFWCSAIVLAVVCFGLIGLVWNWDPSSLDFLYPGAFLDFAVVYLGVGVLMLFSMAAAKIPCLLRSISFGTFELYVLAMLLLLVCVSVLSHPPFLVAVRGYDLEIQAEDTSPLLFLVGLVVGAHSTPLVRWHMLIPFQVLSVLVYYSAVLAVRGLDIFGGHSRYAAQLGCIVACASFAKRRNQRQERERFLLLIAERTSRATTEFQLEQQVGMGGASRPADARSTDESLPTTTETERAFRPAPASPPALGHLLAIGKKEQWVIESKDLAWDKDHILGVGGYGVVIQGYYQGVSVAVKLPKASPQSRRSRSHLASLCNELQILRHLRHPNCVAFLGAWLDEEHGDLALVLELVHGLSLRNFVQQRPPNESRSQVLAQVGCALNFLHAQLPKVVHSDLKDTNIFVESRAESRTESHHGDFVAKLLDFGLARRLTKSARPSGGSVAWMAPEVAQGRAPTPASDIFSFGRVMYLVATGRTPGEGRRHEEMLADLRAGIVPRLVWAAEDAFAVEYRSVVRRCSEVDVTLRPGSSEVYEAAIQIWENHGGPGMRSSGAQTRESLLRELAEVRRAAKQWRPPAAKPLAQSVASGHVGRRQDPSQLSPVPVAPGQASSVTRLYPGFELTPLHTLVDYFLAALVRCNFDMPTEVCCSFHGAAQHLLGMVAPFREQGCVEVRQQAMAQCNECGFIATSEDGHTSGDSFECFYCGEVLDARCSRAPHEEAGGAGPT